MLLDAEQRRVRQQQRIRFKETQMFFCVRKEECEIKLRSNVKLQNERDSGGLVVFRPNSQTTAVTFCPTIHQGHTPRWQICLSAQHSPAWQLGILSAQINFQTWTLRRRHYIYCCVPIPSRGKCVKESCLQVTMLKWTEYMSKQGSIFFSPEMSVILKGNKQCSSLVCFSIKKIYPLFVPHCGKVTVLQTAKGQTQESIIYKIW